MCQRQWGDNPAREGLLFWGTPTSELSGAGQGRLGGEGGGVGMALLPGCSALAAGWGCEGHMDSQWAKRHGQKHLDRVSAAEVMVD